MAKKEALRELQSRLAERLQAARTEARTANWLAVESGGQGFLLPLAEAGEIFPVGAFVPVPHTVDWFLGVANLRGGLYGVVDLASFVAGSAPVPRAEGARAESRLVALNAALEVNCALLIDRLAGLRNVESFTSSALPPEGAPAYFGSGYTEPNGAYWQEINLQTLSQQPDFLSISA